MIKYDYSKLFNDVDILIIYLESCRGLTCSRPFFAFVFTAVDPLHLQDPPRYSESMRDLQRLLDDGIWTPDVSLSSVWGT